MPKFCPNCGIELSTPEAKFCPECGFAFKRETVSQEETVQEDSVEEEEFRASIADLGNRLEEMVERIFQANGYETERRKRLEGKSGTRSEIDVIARRSGKIIAIECKNYSDPVGIDKMRDFAQKLQDLGAGWNGIFVSPSDFTDEAARLAQYRRIETWGHDEITEKWMKVSLGRVESRKGQSLTLNYALPLNVDFIQATQISLQNKDKVKVSNVELIYHPYFAIEYYYRARFKDPTKKLHKFEDRDTLFVDALDGDVINPLPAKGIGILARTIKVVASVSARAENERSKKFLQELRKYSARREYPLNIENDYRVDKLKPVFTPRQAEKACIDFITEKNTQKVTYRPKDEEIKLIAESVTYVPKRNDIRITRRDIVVVPRWSVDFDSLGTSYTKEILAYSGTVLEDTLSYCPKHFKLGAITLISKKTIAVCEVCGQSLCEDHIKRCPTCNKWLCEEHGTECSVCQNRFCVDHITLTCSVCNSPICNSCVTTCPVCNAQYGKDHAVTCNQCGTLVCPNCVITTGFIRKTRTCKKCAS